MRRIGFGLYAQRVFGNCVVVKRKCWINSKQLCRLVLPVFVRVGTCEPYPLLRHYCCLKSLMVGF